MERLGHNHELIKARYDRHIRLTDIGEKGQIALLNAKVLVVGVGGLGSPIALYLTAAGVGTLGLIDADIVSLSNLQRQVLYREADLGLSKVECAKKHLLALNNSIVINNYPCRLTSENAEEIISQYDVVVDGCDNFETRYLMDEICGKLQIPYVYGSIGAFEGQISVFHYNAEGKAYQDLFPKTEAPSDQPRIEGVMGVVPGIVGSMQAAEVIKILTGAGTPLVNKLLIINVLKNQQFVLDY